MPNMAISRCCFVTFCKPRQRNEQRIVNNKTSLNRINSEMNSQMSTKQTKAWPNKNTAESSENEIETYKMTSPPFLLASALHTSPQVASSEELGTVSKNNLKEGLEDLQVYMGDSLCYLDNLLMARTWSFDKRVRRGLDTFILKLACVAGGISRASAFVAVAKKWTRVAKPWEDWRRVEWNFTRGFAAREFPHGLRQGGNMAALPLARSRIPSATQAILKQAFLVLYLTTVSLNARLILLLCNSVLLVCSLASSLPRVCQLFVVGWLYKVTESFNLWAWGYALPPSNGACRHAIL